MARFKNVSGEARTVEAALGGRFVLEGQVIDVPEELLAVREFPASLWEPIDEAPVKKSAKSAATTTEES